MTYRRHPSPDMSRPLRTPGPVLSWDGGDYGQSVIFSCPCGEREVYVTERKGHEILFDDDDRLTINGSCGYAPKPDLGRPANWCHFFMRAGEIEMCSDSKCPGANP